MSSKIKIGLVQMNSGFLNGNYLPYSVGLLQAYVQRHAQDPAQFEFLPPLYRRLPVEKASSLLRDAHVIGFSVYVWNIRISLEVARRVKLRNPDVLIVFGGPHVPDQAESFLRQHPFIDVACHGEGESIFLGILEQYRDPRWDEIPSISFLKKDGSFVHHPKGQRIKDLLVIPSPYLDGIFEPLITRDPKEQWIGLWETNRGCPFSCTFCDWGSATASKVYTFDLERVLMEVEWFANHRIEYIFCCDANFGILPRDLEIAKFLAETKKGRGYPHVLNITTTKNATDRSYQVQKILAEAGLFKGATLAMQSLDAVTLKNIKRDNISLESYKELQRRFSADGIETYSDLIIGLPGETYDTFFDGIAQIVENGQHNRTQFYNFSILPNAEVGGIEYQKKYGLVTVESTIINIHGFVAESEDGINESQQLVIATATMPRDSWRKSRVLCWMTSLLHFDKLLQIPFVILHDIGPFRYRELFEIFMEHDLAAYPLLLEIRTFLWEKAGHIQNGGDEYCHSKEWLNIWWPADEYVLIKLSVEGKLDEFYREAEMLFQEFLNEKSSGGGDILHDAILLNKHLVIQPFQTRDADVEVSHNIWEMYQAGRRGQKFTLERQSRRYRIDRTSRAFQSWDDWFREVVWYGSRQGAYLYKKISAQSSALV